MTLASEFIEAVTLAIPDHIQQVQQWPLDEVVLTISANALVSVVRDLREKFGYYHLSTITGIDTGNEVEILYHFWHKIGITLRLVLPYQHLQVPSLTDTIPGAALYEREIAEMFGITVDGLADTSPLLLPDDWDGSAPMRKGAS
jgi:membrane-bound hydrogenase subunit beta